MCTHQGGAQGRGGGGDQRRMNPNLIPRLIFAPCLIPPYPAPIPSPEDPSTTICHTHTVPTTLSQYTAADLLPYTNAVKAAGGSGGGALAVGVGVWYYVALPLIRVYAIVEIAGSQCGIASPDIFNCARSVANWRLSNKSAPPPCPICREELAACSIHTAPPSQMHAQAPCSRMHARPHPAAAITSKTFSRFAKTDRTKASQTTAEKALEVCTTPASTQKTRGASVKGAGR